MTKKSPPELKVIESEEVPTEVLAKSIVEISHGVAKLLAGPLRRRTIELLIRDASKQPASAVKAVLDGIEQLRQRYVK